MSKKGRDSKVSSRRLSTISFNEEKSKNVCSPLYLRFLQTFALIRSPFGTLFRISIPSICVLFLYIIKESLISQTNNYYMPLEEITSFDSISGKILYSYEDLTFLNNSEIKYIVRDIAKKGGLTIDNVDSWGYGLNFGDECNTDMCKIRSCETIKFIMQRQGLNDSNGNEDDKYGAFCLKQYDDGIDYYIYRDSATEYANPFAGPIGYLPSIPKNDIFTHIQRLISSAVIEMGTFSRTMDDEKFTMKIQTPLSERVQLDFIPMVFGGMCYFLALYLLTFITHFEINEEKRKRLREGMVSMGLTDFAYWTSWFLYQGLLLFIGVILMIITGYICGLHFFLRTDPTVLFIVFFLTGLTLISNLMCCSTCCSGTITTTLNSFTYLVISVALVLAWVDIRFVENIEIDLAMDISLPNVFMGIFFLIPFTWIAFLTPGFLFGKVIWDINEVVHDVGLNDFSLSQRFNVFHLFDFALHPKSDTGIPYFNWWIMAPFVPLVVMFVILIISLFMTWYLDNILPRPNYRPLPFYYIFSLRYWGLYRGNDYLQVDTVKSDFKKEGFILPDLDEDIINEYRKVMDSLEEDPDCRNIPLKIVKISKIFSKLFSASSTTALNEITLCCERGKCLVVLGHNGAGKTTLFNILTGAMSPDTGDALVYNNSVSVNTQFARRLMGVCPQHDIIFPYLTCKMHLLLYACLKGLPVKEIFSSSNELLKKVLLGKKSNSFAQVLSGGQKRRLSLAMSIIGDPKILFLDEPTSGMDPSVRRKIWNFITELKKDKIIVLTSHSMEEADALGDKIAILAKGRLRCVGSTLHLKKRYGGDYQIKVILKNKKAVKNFRKEVKKIGQLEHEVSDGSSIIFSIPHEVTQQTLNFFKFIEKQTEENKIVDYTLAEASSLEEVFIKATHGSKTLLENLEKRKKMESDKESQLKILIEGQSNPFTSIDITKEWTLINIRKYINEHHTYINSDYLFVFDDIVLKKRTEGRKIAQKFWPVLTIRLKDQPKLFKEDNANLKSQSEVINIEEEEEEKEEEEKDRIILHQKEQINRLMKMVEDLQNEVKELKEEK